MTFVEQVYKELEEKMDIVKSEMALRSMPWLNQELDLKKASNRKLITLACLAAMPDEGEQELELKKKVAKQLLKEIAELKEEK